MRRRERDLAAAAAELGALGVGDLGRRRARGFLCRVAVREGRVGFHGLDARVVEPELAHVGREVGRVGQAAERIRRGHARERERVVDERVQSRRREVAARRDRRRVADEDADARASLARALELLDLAEANADLETVALADDRVGGVGAGPPRACDQGLGDVAEVH